MMGTPRRSFAVLLAAVAALTFGCVSAGPSTVERVVGGMRRRGPWIPPSAYEHFVRAELLALEGRDDEALREYELARSGVVDDFLLAREATVAARRGNDAWAARLIEEGLRDEPRSEPLLRTRAEIARARGDLAAAERDLRLAREAHPESVAVALALTRVLVDVGRNAEAAAILEEAAAHAPEEVALVRAMLAHAMLSEDSRRAALAAMRLARLAPGRREEIVAAAESALERGRAALAHVVLRVLPPAAREIDLRFRAALATGDRDECERLAVRSDDGSLAGRLASADRWLALGDVARAEELARSVLLEAPGDVRATRLLASALVREERFVEAAEILGGSSGHTSEEAFVGPLLRAALEGAGVPALAAEVGRRRTSMRDEGANGRTAASVDPRAP